MSVKASGLKKGDILSEHQYYTVKTTRLNSTDVVNDKGSSMTIANDIISKDMFSAHQYDVIEKVSRTTLIELIKLSPNTAMTIFFRKQVKKADVLKELEDLYANKGGTIISKKEYSKRCAEVLDKVLNGDPRTIVGRHHGNMTEHGRLNFVDMELPKDTSKSYETRSRQVDPRTVEWAIIKNTKYVVK